MAPFYSLAKSSVVLETHTQLNLTTNKNKNPRAAAMQCGDFCLPQFLS